MGRGLLLWLLGVPIPIILLIWLFGGLHTLDFPLLRSSPLLRTIAIVALCLWGLAFSLTGALLAWRRLRTTVGELFEKNGAARG